MKHQLGFHLCLAGIKIKLVYRKPLRLDSKQDMLCPIFESWTGQYEGCAMWGDLDHLTYTSCILVSHSFTRELPTKRKLQMTTSEARQHDFGYRKIAKYGFYSHRTDNFFTIFLPKYHWGRGSWTPDPLLCICHIVGTNWNAWSLETQYGTSFSQAFLASNHGITSMVLIID